MKQEYHSVKKKPLDPESIEDKIKKIEDVRNLGIPPSIKLKMKQLRIDIYRGMNIASLDSVLFGLGKRKSDPYVEINYAGMIQRTKVCKSTATPGRPS